MCAALTAYREGTRSMRRCVYRKQLDLETLVCTRGPNFPLSRLESRLMCPACGNRRIAVVFEPPSNAQVGSGESQGLVAAMAYLCRPGDLSGLVRT
jgi:hypothetical protein